jgi:dTDP-4-dehydrorhamnose 3,5-epimerase-like enzyme
MKKKKIITGIEIVHLDDVSQPGDKRGTVFEWKNFTNGKTVQITGYVRKKGVVFGNHFHKGTDPSKNPEFFFVIHGEIELWAWNKFTDEEATIRLTPGTVMTIWPHVLHKCTAITDVVYAEPRITEFDKKKPDTFPPEEYSTYQK